MAIHNYWVYIITNPKKSVLYIGVTNNLAKRLESHFQRRGDQRSFAGKYHCYNLIHYEHFNYIINAIAREKQLKKWNRKKKVVLIEKHNPNWEFKNSLFTINHK